VKKPTAHSRQLAEEAEEADSQRQRGNGAGASVFDLGVVHANPLDERVNHPPNPNASRSASRACVSSSQADP